MGFRQWYESTIQFTGWCRDGRVFLAIDGKKYTYAVDAIHHDKLRALARYRPGKALNDLIKRGAQQIDPLPIQNPPSPPSPPNPPRQRTLF